MKSACVGVLSIIELKNARWNIEILRLCRSLEHYRLDRGTQLLSVRRDVDRPHPISTSNEYSRFQLA